MELSNELFDIVSISGYKMNVENVCFCFLNLLSKTIDIIEMKLIAN